MTTSKKISLKFSHAILDKPIVYKLIRDFGLEFNILRASITQEEEGLMVLELTGDDLSYSKGIDFLKANGVEVELLDKEVQWLEDKCIQCGACVTICPTQALKIDRKTMMVSFDREKCIACELCVKPCPVRAFEVRLF